MPSNVVRIANPSDGRRFVGKYDGEKYIIEPGMEAVAPWEAACLWLGNPNFVDDGSNKARRDEYNRLTVKYGAYENEAIFDQNKPTIVVHELDGQRLPMLIDDPDGDSIVTASQTVREQNLMESRFEEMEREMQMLKRRLRARGDSGDDEPLAQDTPLGDRKEPRIGTLGDGDDHIEGELEEDTPTRVAVGE